jgi:Acyl-CoA-binding protein
MSASALIDLALSSFIFAFPRKYIIDNYLKVRKLIKSTFKSKKSNTESDNLAENQDGTSLTPELDAKFKEACKVVERSSFLSHQQLIHLYGLYKQALMGDCTRPKPSQSDIFEYRKWYSHK